MKHWVPVVAVLVFSASLSVPAGAQTVSWLTPPPASAAGGDALPVLWQLSGFTGTITENQAHFGISTVLGSSPVQAGANGAHTYTFTAPNISVFDSPRTFTYIARALEDGVQVLSAPALTAVTAGPSPPQVTWVTAPPATFTGGGQFTVQWQVQNYTAPAATNGLGYGLSTVWGTLCNQPAGDGTYSCTVTVPAPTADTTLAFTAYADNGVEFAFAAPVLVQFVAPAVCSLAVTAPNGGEAWRPGTTHTVTWSGDTLVGPNVRLVLLRDGVVERVIVESTPNDGSHAWTVPLGLLSGDRYSVRVEDVGGPVDCNDESDGWFAVWSNADVAGRNASTGQWWVGVSNGTAFTSTVWTTWAPAVTWVDVRVGDFTGDGRADIAGRDAATGIWWVAVSTGTGFATANWGTWSAAVPWTDVRVGDFTGDGLADLAGRNATTGAWQVARSTGSGFVSAGWGAWSGAVTWVDVHAGDFTGDGRADLAGRNATTGAWQVARSTGSGFVSTGWGTWSAAVPWTDVRVGDFTGDGLSDLAGRNATTGAWQVARSTGTAFVSTTWGTWSGAVIWTDIRAADFTGDGRADVAGRNASSGQWSVAVSTGTGFVTAVWGSWSAASIWADVQAGDFTGDGRADLAGRNATTGAWQVARSTGSGFVTTPWGAWATGVVWADVQAGEFTGD